MQMAPINFMPLNTHFAFISQSCQEINEKKHLKVIWLFLVYFTVRENDQHHPWESRHYSGRAKSFTTCHSGNRPVAEHQLTPGFTHGVHAYIYCLRYQTAASSQTAPSPAQDAEPAAEQTSSVQVPWKVHVSWKVRLK